MLTREEFEDAIREDFIGQLLDHDAELRTLCAQLAEALRDIDHDLSIAGDRMFVEEERRVHFGRAVQLAGDTLAAYDLAMKEKP